MKTRKNFFSQMLTKALLLIGFSLVVVACEKDDEKLGEIPSLTISRETAQNANSKVVSTTLSIAAPEGAKELIVLKNGVQFQTVPMNGQKTSTYDFNYTINEAIGSTINFTFQVIDKKDRISASSPVFAVLVTAKPIVVVEAGNYLGQTNWTSDNIYFLKGYVRIGSDVKQSDGTHAINRGNNVLNIEAGTVILGDKETKAVLIIQRGAKINAQGTAENPIVFTSEQPVGMRLPGDWGGVVICGETVNNQGQNIEMEGNYGAFHGGTVTLDDATHSSGILKYVRIEYAGVPINPNQEVNSLTMGSVGKGTVIEHVQASYGLDDAFEWFGGSVDAKYLIAYRGLDDDFDVDFGYSGHVQFAIGIRDNNFADQSGSNGFEVDNNGDGDAYEPFTSARFSNVTIIGPKKNSATPLHTQFQHGAQLRRASKLRIYNSFITGYPYGIYIDDTKGNTSNYATAGELRIRNTIIAGVDGWGGNGYGSVYDAAAEGTIAGLPFGSNANHGSLPRGTSLRKSTASFDIVGWFNTPAYRNKQLAKWTDAGIDETIFDLGRTPKLTPNAGSMLLDYAAWNNIPEADKFEQVSFIGAFGATNWAANWAEFMPQTVVYY